MLLPKIVTNAFHLLLWRGCAIKLRTSPRLNDVYRVIVVTHGRYNM